METKEQVINAVKEDCRNKAQLDYNEVLIDVMNRILYYANPSEFTVLELNNITYDIFCELEKERE